MGKLFSARNVHSFISILGTLLCEDPMKLEILGWVFSKFMLLLISLWWVFVSACLSKAVLAHDNFDLQTLQYGTVFPPSSFFINQNLNNLSSSHVSRKSCLYLFLLAPFPFPAVFFSWSVSTSAELVILPFRFHSKHKLLKLEITALKFLNIP